MGQEINGPHIRIAVFCREIATGPNRETNILGIYDRIEMHLEDLPTTITLCLAIGVVRGDAIYGDCPLTLIWHKPDGSRIPPITIPFFLPDSVPYLSAPLVTVPVETFGTHWLDLLFFQRLLTRVALPVVQAENPQPVAIQ